VQEVIALSLEDVVVYRAGDRVREMGLWVRRSKTDEEDLGALVVRQCVCKNQSLAHCPGCTLWNHAQGRLLVAQDLGGQAGIGGAPLFHNGCGRRLTVAEVLSAVEDTALEAGEPLRGEMGQRRFGTHSMRVRGACMAYAAGLPETTIMALGRWTSLDGMRRYLRGAPIRRASQATQEIARAMCEGRAPLDPTRMSGVPLVACGPAVEQSQGGPAGHIQVLLGTTGVLHRPLGFEGPPEQWSTFCGIRWANKGVAGDFSYKKEEKCRRCFSAAAAP